MVKPLLTECSLSVVNSGVSIGVPIPEFQVLFSQFHETTENIAQFLSHCFTNQQIPQGEKHSHQDLDPSPHLLNNFPIPLKIDIYFLLI